MIQDDVLQIGNMPSQVPITASFKMSAAITATSYPDASDILQCWTMRGTPLQAILGTGCTLQYTPQPTCEKVCLEGKAPCAQPPQFSFSSQPGCDVLQLAL